MALLEYLKSAAGRKIIARLSKGTTIQRINVKEFASVRIPELTADIKRLSQSLFGKEVKILEKIDELYASMEELRLGYLSGR